ncbi:hypothetical protein F3K40_10210 [Streptomyces sp. LBUM 1478]|nr:hypothetical protein [Streptomyces sp. LBUM 1485]MBP5875910.1 hypothetical protein [Streptomyces sp. LBUM 1477]MBP5883630.1 hypothetical protein [Streptomyces sp. LBUM 1487]MBP5893545.1 hypothetical protein [Streptomyces sp. LBUM 1481]MBP5899655.1 hypothetical protein [Streptomyces sp. LBUM 1488]MBP5906063.1 hypothetical protein [Streptomyces sp. LBUM 1478]MBP5916761.1 hypothetical protein [Streptomyces sp. LBUM 1486]MBP5923788.1 hypothetical protein [Streptomyces sp. LBUM 1483]MBP593138
MRMSRAPKAARRIAAAVLALGSVLLLSPSPAQAAGWEELKNDNSRKCLAIPHGSGSSTARPIQWTCSGDAEQQWELRRVTDEWYQLVNRATGECLIGVDAGAKPTQFTCTESPWHLWKRDSINRLHTYSTSAAEDNCLAVPNSSTTNGVEVIVWPCSLNHDQRWL